MRILVLDDELLVAKALVRLLGSHLVEISHTCSDAYAKIESFAPELIFSDLRLARECGLAFLEDVAITQPNLNNRLVLMTGGIVKASDSGRAEGFPVLHKPFGRESVTRIFRTLNIENSES